MLAYEQLVKVIQQGNYAKTQNLVEALLNQGKSADEIIQEGIIVALDIVGKQFSVGECYIPEMLVAARASQKGLDILRPLLVKTRFKPRGKVVIGTVKGDLHEIGKNILVMMLKGAGFHVIDLGFDVAPEKFVKALKTENAQVLAMSCLLTTTMISMENTMEALREAGLYGKVKVMIGGPPTTDDFAQEIGADFRGRDAYEGVEQARRFVS
ncbi:MAG: B12-binding domain-containing protein [Thermodesulfobacteriota bacterium]